MKRLKIKMKKGLSLSGISIKFDWVFLFLFILFSLILATVISLSIYISIEKKSILSSEEEVLANPLRVNTEQLERVVENLNSRKARFDELTGGIILSTSTPEQVDLVE
jgi:hypothetical protein